MKMLKDIDWGDFERQLRADARREDEERHEAEQRRLRPPAAHPCVSCGGELTPVVESEPFTMHTVIGAPVRRWHAGYVCERCHLTYAPSARAKDG